MKAILSKTAWQRLLDDTVALTGLNLRLHGDQDEVLAKTAGFGPIVLLQERSRKRSDSLSKHLSRSKELLGIVPLVAEIQLNTHQQVKLVCSQYRVEGTGENFAAAEQRISQFARKHRIEEAKVRRAYLRCEPISVDQIQTKQEQFDKAVQYLESEARLSILEVVIAKVRKHSAGCTIREFWQRVAKLAEQLLPTSRFEVISVTQATPTAVTTIYSHGRQRKSAKASELIDLTPEDCQVNEAGHLLLAIRASPWSTAAVRVVPRRRATFNSQEIACLRRFVSVVGQQLLSIHEAATSKLVSQLDRRLGKMTTPSQRLAFILEKMARMLDCDTGYVLVPDPKKPKKWLKIVRRWGIDDRKLTYNVPADQGITGRVTKSRLPALITDVSQDLDFLWVLRNMGKLNTLYQDDHWAKFQEFLRSIGSCAQFPLCIGGEIVGVICLSRQRVGDFDPELVEAAKVIADRATIEATRYVENERRPQYSSSKVRKLVDVEHRAQRLLRTPADEAYSTLWNELATKALEMSGAYRTGVAVFEPELQTFKPVAIACRDEGSFPKGYFDLRHRLDADTAGVHAFNRGETYQILDTAKKGIHYHVVPPGAVSHVSIVLKVGTHRLGYVGIDWDEPGAFDQTTLAELETLAEHYSEVLRTYEIDHFFETLSADLKKFREEPRREFEYQKFLRQLATIVGSQRGEIFFRDKDSGTYQLTAHLVRPRLEKGEDHRYERGQGITGWVAEHNKPVRIRDISNKEELRRIDINLTWENNILDRKTRRDKTLSYLGIPIAIGDEVLGVLRLSSKRHDHFTISDQQIAMRAAQELAGLVHEQDEQRRSEALMQLSQRTTQSRSQREVAQAAFDALESGLGECFCHIRLLDKVQEADHPEKTVLRRLATNHPDFESTPLTRDHRQGLSGRVWESGNTLTYDDVADDLTQQVRQEDETWGYSPNQLVDEGSGICAPVRSARGNFSGTLRIHKRRRRALSIADVAFVEEVSKIVVPGLQLAGEREASSVELKLKDAGDRFMVGLLRGHTYSDRRSKLLLRVLRSLRSGLSSKIGWVAVPNAAKSEFEVLHAQGIDKNEIPSLPISNLTRVIGDRGFRVVFDLANDPASDSIVEAWQEHSPSFDSLLYGSDQDAIELVRNWQTRHVSLLKDLQICLVSMWAGTDPLAYFSIPVRRPDVISFNRVERAYKLLGQLSETIEVGRRFEEQKLESERSRPLALLGSMLTSLEHETRSPIAIIKRAIAFLLETDRDADVREEMLKAMEEECERLRVCLSNMISLVGVSQNAFQQVDIQQTLEDAIRAATNKSSRLKVEREFPSERVYLSGIGSYLESAFTLVIKNAVEAIAKTNTNGVVSVRLSADSENECRVGIGDNGCGMADDVLKNALIPFYTKGSGTGLGLPAAYSIVRSHEGRLEIDSVPGQGTNVIVSLPISSRGDT